MPTFRSTPHHLATTRLGRLQARVRPVLQRMARRKEHAVVSNSQRRTTGARVRKSTLAYESARALPYASLHFGTRHHLHRSQGSRSGLPVGREPLAGLEAKRRWGPPVLARVPDPACRSEENPWRDSKRSGDGARQYWQGFPIRLAGRKRTPGGTRSEAEMGPASIGKGCFRVQRRRRGKVVC
jgi:hypothetical protein